MNDDDDLVSAGCTDSPDMVLEAQDTLAENSSKIQLYCRAILYGKNYCVIKFFVQLTYSQTITKI